MSDVTQINKEIFNNSTIVNSEIFASQSTVINKEVSDNLSLSAGSLLLDRYRVLEKMNTVTGEAGLYICDYDGQKVAAKLYHREMAVKPEVLTALSKIRSENVAALYEYSLYNGKPIEIMQYFKNGSLQGKRYSYEKLKNMIIPGINEGLKVLHEAGIIHKDLKPSNIMLNDDRKSVSIIDFGISSVENNGNTVIVTRTGMTPEYSAPESFKGLFLEESDYFSFGITLYELYCGTTPYKNLSAEQIAQYSSIQRIPFPDGIPKELKNLISALTYHDITNRNNKNNPNRRWTYDEVRKWCEGISQPVPGEGTAYNALKIPAYKFMGQEFTDMKQFVKTLAVQWNDGKKQLFRGLMSAFFKRFDQEAAGYCMDAEEEAAKISGKDDIIYFRLLYKLDSDMTRFCWKGEVFENLAVLGKRVLEVLNKGEECEFFKDILKNKVMSEYLSVFASDNQQMKDAVSSLENSYQLNINDSRQVEISLYTMGYMLSGQRILILNGRQFGSISELVSYISLLLDDSYEDFEKFCNILIFRNNELDAQFESWLTALGKRKELNKWKQRLSS